MKTPRRFNVEDLLGVRVRATNGRVIGHIEEVRAEETKGAYAVTAFLLGTGALRERLAIARRLAHNSKMTVVRWDQIDLSDPMKPVLTCSVSDLETEP
jgi:sporulation protein YlmC with PRC-barrel domain